MKFKIRFQRRFSVMITIIACASAIYMMVKNFGFPQERVLEIAVTSVILLGAILVIALPVALVIRWVNNRRERDE